MQLRQTQQGTFYWTVINVTINQADFISFLVILTLHIPQTLTLKKVANSCKTTNPFFRFVLFYGGWSSVSVFNALLPFLPLFCVIHVTMAALENEVLRNPKPSLVDRSILELSADQLLPPDIYVDRALLRATGGYDEFRHAGGALRGRKSPRSDSPDSDLDLVAEAKARIQELQEEAETLEEAYRNYHQRAVRSTISPTLPPGPRCPQRARPPRRPGSPLRKQAARRSHLRSPNGPKVSQRPLSPRATRTLSPAPYDTRSTPRVQPRVTFLRDTDQPRSAELSDHSLQSLTENLRDGRAQAANSPPPRRLSSTTHSSSGNTLQRENAEGTLKRRRFIP